MAREASCAYGACMLPQDNKRYLWQLAYIVIGLGVLFFDAKSFTFFQTFLFVAPVLLDIAYVDIKRSKTLNGIRIFFWIYDSALVVMCILGIVGVLVDKGECFAISTTFLFCPGYSIQKNYIGIAIAINLMVPFILWIGAPCQRAMRILEITQGEKRRQEGVPV